MDKKTLIKVIVGVVILLFILEPVAINLINSGINPAQQAQLEGQGRALLKLELTNYKRYIIIQNPEIEVEKLRNIEGVKDVLSFSDKVVVESDDVFSTYKKIRLLNISGTADASLEIKEASLDGRMLNATSTLSVSLEPLIKEGTYLYANADVIYDKNGNVLALGNFELILERKKTTAIFKVMEEVGREYIYVIDWSDRDKAKKMGYEVNDAVLINMTNVFSVLVANNSNYTYYIGNDYILVNSTFTNKSKVKEDFNVIEFKDTYIRSETPLNISFAKEIKETYKYRVINEEYGVEKIIESEDKMEKGAAISIEVVAVYSNDQLLYIE